MTSGDLGALLFYSGLFLMSLGMSGWVLHQWGRELKQALPQFQKANRVEQGESGE